jgi:hypothetical protein
VKPADPPDAGRRKRRRARRVAAAVLLAPLAFGARPARAQGLSQELDVRADQVTVDTRMRELELEGHVHADAPPFHLSAEKLVLRRSSHGVVVEGDGRLTFCPCLATPIALGFKGATVAPPGDLFLTSPRLEIFHVPVFWLPFFWLRAPDRVGLLPPEIAWRGADGLFVGGGVHLPWGEKKSAKVVDLTAGGYFAGGFAASASARSEQTTTLVRFDWLPQSVPSGAPGGGGGLLVDARGALETGGVVARGVRARTAWDFDLLRGARGVEATTDLDAASRTFDVGQAEASVAASSFVVASGVRMAALRGGDLLAADAVGPYLALAGDGAIGSVGAYDATLDASVLHETAAGSLALAHGEVGALVAGRPSIFGVSAEVRGAADAAADDLDHGAAAAALARVEATAPFVRSFETRDRADPIRHRIEPVVAVSALAQDVSGPLADIAARSFVLLGQDAFAPASGVAGIASAGFRSSLARWARGDGLEVEAHAGGLLDDAGNARAAVRWRAKAGGHLLGLTAEGAHVFSSATAASGDAVLLRARVGVPVHGPSVSAHLTVRDGIDPVAARLLTDAPLEPAAGFFATEGITGGMRASVPWTKWLATRGGFDMDLDALVVTAAVGTIELRDTCGCFRIAVNAAHRLGRDGVDVWTTIDLVPH